jgi:sugar lactone lactonase YvrE
MRILLAGLLAAAALAVPAAAQTAKTGPAKILAALRAARKLPHRAGSGSTLAANLVLGHPDFTNTTSISSATLNDNFAVSTGGGILYVADPSNERVLWWNSATSFYTGRGADGVIGQADFASNLENRGASTLAGDMLSDPQALAADSSGGVWIADTGNNRVLHFKKPTAGADAQADIVIGQSDFASYNSGTTRYLLNSPQAVALDLSGNVWVADNANYRILEFAKSDIDAWSSGNSIPASVVLGQTSYTDGTRATTSAYSFLTLGELNFDASGNLWVADASNNRVLGFYANTLANYTYGQNTSADVVLGEPDFATNSGGTTQSTMQSPFGVAADASGDIWVSDEINNRILEFTVPVSSGMNASLVLGHADYTSSSGNDGGIATAYTVNMLTHLNFDASGNLWVADRFNNRVLEYVPPFSTHQAATLALGQPVLDSNASGILDAYALNNTYAELESGGRIYVADCGYNRILWWNSATSYTNGHAADGVIGQTDFLHNQAAVTPTAATLSCPSGLAADSSGNIWVADAANNRVLRFAKPAANGESANFVVGQTAFNSNNSATAADGLSFPMGLAFDPSGSLWIADSSNERILGYKTATLAAGSYGPSADYALGAAGCSASGTGDATQSGFYPAGLASDSSGNILVADNSNSRILGFSSTTVQAAVCSEASAPNAALVLGEPDYTSNSGGDSQSLLSNPDGITVDNIGNLWTADSSNNRIIEYSSSTVAAAWNNPGTWNASGVIGQADYTSGAYGTAANMLDYALGVSAGSSGSLWVADSGNSRILRFAIGRSISGGISAGGSTLGGVTLTLTGSYNATLTSGADGTFDFAGLPDGTYTVTPSLSGYTFTPASKQLTISGSDVTSLSFAASGASYTLSGTITYNSAALQGVTVAVSGSSTTSTATDASGAFSFSLPAGSYTLTPTLGGYTFNPTSVSSTSLSGNWTGNNFIASKIVSGYAVSGTVTSGGAALSGVTVSYTGTASGSATTDANGAYSFTLPNGSYTLKPSLSGYVLTPTTLSVTVNSSAVADNNFVGLQTHGKVALVQGGHNGYAEPTKGYPATITLTNPPASGMVTVKIYTLRDAHLARTLTVSASAGTPAQFVWDCRDGDGSLVGSGVYIAVVNGAGYDNEHVKIGVLK